MRKKQNGKNDFMPFDKSNTLTDFDEKQFQLSIHLSGGIFRSKLRHLSELNVLLILI